MASEEEFKGGVCREPALAVGRGDDGGEEVVEVDVFAAQVMDVVGELRILGHDGEQTGFLGPGVGREETGQCLCMGPDLDGVIGEAGLVEQAGGVDDRYVLAHETADDLDVLATAVGAHSEDRSVGREVGMLLASAGVAQARVSLRRQASGPSSR